MLQLIRTKRYKFIHVLFTEGVNSYVCPYSQLSMVYYYQVTILHCTALMDISIQQSRVIPAGGGLAVEAPRAALSLGLRGRSRAVCPWVVPAEPQGQEWRAVCLSGQEEASHNSCSYNHSPSCRQCSAWVNFLFVSRCTTARPQNRPARPAGRPVRAARLTFVPRLKPENETTDMGQYTGGYVSEYKQWINWRRTEDTAIVFHDIIIVLSCPAEFESESLVPKGKPERSLVVPLLGVQRIFTIVILLTHLWGRETQERGRGRGHLMKRPYMPTRTSHIVLGVILLYMVSVSFSCF